MKKIAVLSITFLISLIDLNAQSISVDLTKPSDSLFFTMDPTTEEAINKVFFRLTKGNKFNFGQVTMKAHALDPFNLPKISLNNKVISAGIKFPNLAEEAVFTYNQTYDTSILNLKAPTGEHAAELNFIFSKKQLIEGDNEIKIAINNKANQNNIIITDLKLNLRAPVKTDIIRNASEFPGGIKGWVRYLERSLNRDLPVNNRAPVGKYTVILNFMVDQEGNLFDIKALNNPGYGTAEEALRVLKNGPKWIPAIENGVNVVDEHRQAIVFVVQ